MTKYLSQLGLINPKSPDNVGAILRAAANYDVNKVVYTGHRYPRAIERSARSVDMSRKIGRNIPIEQTDSLIDSARAEGLVPICIEFAENAIALPEFNHPDNAFYIFGPEDGSIEQEIIDQADFVVFVPTIGSMNLSASVNVLLYDRLAKSARYGTSNDFIKSSRDTNNRLKVSTS